MFTDAVTLENASLKAITHKMKAGTISGHVTVRGPLTFELAKTLGCADLTHLANGAPRSSFDEIKLRAACKAFRAVFQVIGLKQSYEMDGDEAGEMMATPVKNGLALEMRLAYHGDPLPLISYWMHVGEAKGPIIITPLQKEMEAAAASSVEIHVTDAKGHTHVQPVSKGDVRKAVLAGSGKKKWGKGVQ